MSNGAEPTPQLATRVLVCDDSDAMRALLGITIALGEQMTVVGEAADGNAAIGEAERLQPDVILLDLSMPVKTGFDALPEIHRVAPEATIIVLSGFSSANVADQVLALGASSYLQKGSAPDMILAAIGQARAHPRRNGGTITSAPADVAQPQEAALA